MLEDIKRYINENVKPVDFKVLLKEADGEDKPKDGSEKSSEESESEPSGESEDLNGDSEGPPEGFDDLGGDPGGDFGGDFGGPSGDFEGDEDFSDIGPSSRSGSKGDELSSSKNGQNSVVADREPDPEFTKGALSSDGSAAEAGPASIAVYDLEGVLKGLNSTIQSDEIDLSEIDSAKLILELICNGKKLADSDFENIKNYDSFSDIVKRSLLSVDENTRNYVTMKIKKAILDMQNQKKIDVDKAEGEVNDLRNAASSL